MFHPSFYYSTLTLASSRWLLQNVEHGDGEDKAKTNAEDKAQKLFNGLTVSLCQNLGYRWLPQKGSVHTVFASCTQQNKGKKRNATEQSALHQILLIWQHQLAS